MPDAPLRSALDGAVLTLTIDRPEKKNALTRALYTALAEALDGAAADDAVRAVVVAGSGGAFTAGNDLGDFLEDPPLTEDAPVFRFLRALAAFPKPLFAAVEGAAVGVGTTMLLHCDLVYAAPSAVFRLPFTDLGLVPEAASSLLLPLVVGPRRAAELLLFGERFSAEDAYRWELINGVVEDPLAHAQDRARVLAAKPPEAVRLTKALLRRAPGGAVGETMREEGRLFAERLQSPEAQAAFAAFLRK